MNKELEHKLIEKYPKIFANCYKDPQTTCMAWGLEVGDGWYNLIDVLCEALTYTYTTSVKVDEEDGKRLGIEPNIFKEETSYYFKVESPQVIADQVKEKFGTLRFYYHLEFDKNNVELIKTGKYPQLVEINKRYSDYIDGIIHFADIASARICEVSGTSGQLHVRGGWFKVISNDVAKTEQYSGFKPYETQN